MAEWRRGRARGSETMAQFLDKLMTGGAKIPIYQYWGLQKLASDDEQFRTVRVFFMPSRQIEYMEIWISGWPTARDIDSRTQASLESMGFGLSSSGWWIHEPGRR